MASQETINKYQRRKEEITLEYKRQLAALDHWFAQEEWNDDIGRDDRTTTLPANALKQGETTVITVNGKFLQDE